MSELTLELRTPMGMLLNQTVHSLMAEDRSGWFGLRPGRAEMMAVLPPGLMVIRDAEGEQFVALASGLLHLRDAVCRVAAAEAVVSRTLEDVADVLDAHLARRRLRSEVQRGAAHDLAREALRRLARGLR